MNSAVSAVLAIVGGIITLAIVSVLISKNAQTPQVLGAAGGALSGVIAAAVSPVTGTGSGASPGSGGGSSGNFGGLLSSFGNFSGDITSLSNIGSLFGG